MYTPNFCCECGAKLLRLHWHLWNSRKFCGKCARSLRRSRLVSVLWLGLILIGSGFVAGRYRRPVSPPLIIQRRADSPLSDQPGSISSAVNVQTGANSHALIEAETIYQCGARTKKGTPCSRRVHGPVRCWQHKGMPAMLPEKKLMVK